MQNTSLAFRLAFIAETVRRSPIPLGRTGVMKLAFFLQTIRNVPLGYVFRIYTYGPYDGQVLEDLRIAESVGAVETKAFRFSDGTGVHITKGQKSERIASAAGTAVVDYSADIDWVISNFANKSASDLEVESTIVFVDRSKGCRECVDIKDIISTVHSIKPHHSAEKISKEASALSAMGLLSSVRNASR